MTSPTTIVTGASSGIGAAVARQLAAQGHRVGLVARSKDALNAVLDQLVVGGPHLTVSCDVSDPEQVTRAVDEITAHLGLPTGLVNAAGVCHPAPLDEVTPEQWLTTIGVNLTGTFLVSQAFCSRLSSVGVRGGIVNIGSEAGTIGMPHYAAYCASKAGVIGLTRAMAAELAPHVRVNALCPGPVDTPMLRSELALSGDPDAAWEAELSRVPLHLVATPDEVAEAAVWLLGARHATGTVLALDGGTTGAFYATRG